MLGLLGIGVLLSPRNPIAVPPVTGTIRPGDLWPEDFEVRLGDRAVGVGQLVARANETTRLCTGLDGVVDVGNPQYRCSPVSVEVRGIDVRSLPGVQEMYGATFVNAVVHGRWDGNALTVDGIGGASLQLPVAPILGCQFEVPGAIVQDPQSGETEAVYRHLQDIVDSDPTTYAGLWVAATDRRIVHIATTGNLVNVGAELRKTFPFPLCLAQVQFSANDLKEAAAKVETQGDRWSWIEVDAKRNRVLVRIPALDAKAIEAAQGEPSIELLPLVMRER